MPPQQRQEEEWRGTTDLRRRGQNEREAIRQIAQTGDLHQNAESLWKIARPKDQVADNEAKTAEEDQAHAKAIAMRFERQARHGVELLRRKCFEVSSIPQRKQRPNEIQLSRGFEADRYQIEECRQQSEISADWSEQDKQDQ